MNYYLFRHGETFFSKYHIPYGPFQDTAKILPSSVPITKRIAEFLKDIPDNMCFSSPYLRCRQTVKIIEEETGKKFSFDSRLGEYRNESFRQMEKRFIDFVNDTKTKKCKNIIVCSHGWPIACFVDVITKGKLSIASLKHHPKTGVVVTISGKERKRLNFNHHNPQV